MRLPCLLLALLGLASPWPAWAQNAAMMQLLQEADASYDRADFATAAAKYDRAITDTQAANPGIYAKRASIFLFEKRYSEGLDWITNTAEKAYPDDPLILSQKAIILSKIEGKKAEAVELALKVVVQRPDAFTLHLLIGDFYYKAGMDAADETISAYEAYLKHRPKEAGDSDNRILVKLGLRYLDKKKFAQAEKRFSAALRPPVDRMIAIHATKGLCATFAGLESWREARDACEKVSRDKALVQEDTWVYLHLGKANLKLKRHDDALAAASAYVRLRPRSPDGYILRSLVHFERQAWQLAEEELARADQVSPNNPEVAHWQGRMYLGRKPPNPKKAIERLTLARAGKPDDADVVADLSAAFLADRRPAEAARVAEEGLAMEGQSTNVRLLIVHGHASYDMGNLTPALQSYVSVLEEERKNRVAREGAVLVLNRIAGEKLKAGDLEGAAKHLGEALSYQASSPETNLNTAIVALEAGNGTRALAHLEKVPVKKGENEALLERLRGKAHVLAGHPAAAQESYARALTEAQRLRNKRLVGEVRAEWGPLVLAEGRTDEAIEMLKQSIQDLVASPLARAASRNLQLAFFRQGLGRLKARQPAQAATSFENALREPEHLKGEERSIVSFALGLALLQNGQAARALSIFQAMEPLAGSTQPWLKPPFDKIGIDFFIARALYGSGTVTAYQKAIERFKLILGKGGMAPQEKIKELIQSSWELLAYEQYAKNMEAEAAKALKEASKQARGDRKHAIDHNLAVLAMAKRGGTTRKALEKLADRIPEALVNLGILLDREGDVERAYELWKRAQEKGVRSTDLAQWIDAKRRILGD
ncbi:MAG: tetratricopeptide repeat protein [Deltaproteobacteria bacterium]|nr:tetratricopeptide repeat protein [Deltaproteobacteria bacterium]